MPDILLCLVGKFFIAGKQVHENEGIEIHSHRNTKKREAAFNGLSGCGNKSRTKVLFLINLLS